ncbi:MAG: hypothetical protein VB070_05255 [Clostridiaceae bacterium]|nr:hypothetical protein [Clostridiaceae bacterium]
MINWQKKGVLNFFDRHASLIITDEKQLERIIADPRQPFNVDDSKGFSLETRRLYPEPLTVYDICRQGAEQGAERLEVSYDFFFGGSKRTLYPDSPMTLQAFKIIHDIARSFGLGFSASILSPLDLGPGYAKLNEEAGQSCQYQEGFLDPADGRYKVPMTWQTQWTNNKGPIHLEPVRTIVYAFHEERLGDSRYFYVDPDQIEDISATASLTLEPDSVTVTPNGYGSGKMTVSGCLPAPQNVKRHDRVLAVVVYRTPEIDYFSPRALPYIKSVIDQHKAAGISYQGFYSDEMHIQFDWDLEAHFGLTEINARYLTDSLAAEYARRYGGQYRDLYRYLVYFSYHQHGFLPGTAGCEAAQHVFGRTDAEIHATIQMRSRYFEMLQRQVVDLALAGKRYAAELFGNAIMTRAHATWQESPTCDRFYESSLFQKADETARSRYEYTPEYVWSSSIRENIAACYDYFKWNEFLTGGGSDHPEGGFIDRNYYAQALAASFGILNDVPAAYCASWGSPQAVHRRQDAVRAAFGNLEWSAYLSDNLVQGLQARSSDVLALYPLDLNAFEERFGSWMIQYGYCDYITEEKLLQEADLDDQNRLIIRGRPYRVLLMLFQPFLQDKTLALLEHWVSLGGRVIWIAAPLAAGPAPESLYQRWLELFGLLETAPAWKGLAAGGQEISFSGFLADIPSMTVLSDLLPDLVYPVQPDCSSQVCAWLGNRPIGVSRRNAAGGQTLYLGFRPRDDQSCSTGQDVDTLFRILKAAGGYNPAGAEILSRPASSPWLIQAFPNGAVSIACHYRTLAENWPGSFFRDAAQDEQLLAGRELPPENLQLKQERILGHTLDYEGVGVMTYLISADGGLCGFSGSKTVGLTVDQNTWRFCDQPATIAFGCVPQSVLPDPDQPIWLVYCDQAVEVRLPAPAEGCWQSVYTADLPFMRRAAGEPAGSAVPVKPQPDPDHENALIWQLTFPAGGWLTLSRG